MWQVQLPMPRMPLAITCRADGCVSFAPIAQFDVVIDQLESGEQIVVNEQQITLGNNQHITYNDFVRYKDDPTLLKWLQSLQMEQPNFQQQR